MKDVGRAMGVGRDGASEKTSLIAAEMSLYSATEGHNGGRSSKNSSALVCNSCVVTTDNVLVLFELQQLKQLSNINLALCILSLFYVAVNVVGLDWNGHNTQARDKEEIPMHLLEFWATLVFSLGE